MAPKVVAPVKGQMSLSSFFQKGPAAPAAPSVATCTPSPPVNPIKEAINSSSSNNSAIPMAAVVKPIPVQASKRAETTKSKQKRSRVIEDDDEEAQFDDANPAPNSAPKKPENDENEGEEDWDAMSESESGGDEGSEASDEDDDDDEEEEDEASLVDSDDESPRKRKRSQKPAPKKAFPLPSTARKQVKRGSDLAMVTPAAPRSTAQTPSSTQMNDLFGLCHAGADTPVAGAGTAGSAYKPPLLLAEGVQGMGHHEHDSWAFMKPAQRKDMHGRPMSHPDYNPRTLQVPEKLLKESTPAMAQWWKFKSENMDTVLFFKVGKFYELFHMDADIGFKELDLIYMKGDKAHSGFPEVSYGKFSAVLVAKGYRVARVEQTETPEMLKERNAASKGKNDKVVARELCSIMSKGTRTYCHLDDLSLLDDGNLSSNSTSILFSIKESTGEETEYGICCVDCVLGTVTLAQFADDNQRTRLRTMLAKYSPSEVLLEKGCYSESTLGSIRLLVPQAKLELLRSGEEMLTASAAADAIEKHKYFSEYPAVLKAVLDCLPNGSTTQLVSAIGGSIWHLQRALIDFEIFSMGRFLGYVPPDGHDAAATDDVARVLTVQGAASSILPSGMDLEDASMNGNSNQPADVSTMTLDAVSLANLEILTNNFDRTEKGSLWAFMNRCKTPFGRRLLHEWIVRPLYRPEDISRRAAAVEELLTSKSIEANACRIALKGVPDLERLLSRVHSNGLKKKGRIQHPDSRAIMYEMPIYNSRKIKDFADILAGFETLVKVIGQFSSSSNSNVESLLLCRAVKSPMDQKDCTSASGGKFPFTEVKRLLGHFREIFDERQAKKEGNIKPRPGISREFDEATATVSTVHAELEQYLREQKSATGISDLKFWGTGKDRFQIEVPMNSCSRVPQNWSSKSQKKTHRRYWTPFIEKKLAALVDAEHQVDAAQKDTLRAIFQTFDESADTWRTATACVALLDALLSLAAVSAMPNYTWPTVLAADSDSPIQIQIQDGRHPMLEFAMTDREYIANSVRLGGKCHDSNVGSSMARLMLLSGPNMGGKSTLLRQTCLIAIMAQMGCKVPASSVLMTPVDRIFTRVGASDRILAGQSTFFVELAETATILRQATKDSLCILDELGRGTATFDGTAIAHAVVNHLVSHTRCRAIFATHYHSLVFDWEIDPRAALGHMQCVVQTSLPQSNSTNSAAAKPSAANEEVTFLYQLAPGSSPRSYGINVAKLAQLPLEVILLATKQSAEFEASLAAKDSSCAMDVEGGNGTQSSLAAAAARGALTPFFDRLVSLAASTLPIAELADVAKELWRRLHAARRLL